MTAILSIIGHSGSGKTTLIERLIPALIAKGYRIGTVKHAHQGFSLDGKGKDSYRHKSAGAETVVVASPGGIALFKDMKSDGLSPLLPFFSDMDLVIVEGFKNENRPKLEVFRKEMRSGPISLGDPNLLALITEADVDASVRRFSPEQVREIADFIEEKVLIGRF